MKEFKITIAINEIEPGKYNSRATFDGEIKAITVINALGSISEGTQKILFDLALKELEGLTFTKNGNLTKKSENRVIEFVQNAMIKDLPV